MKVITAFMLSVFMLSLPAFAANVEVGKPAPDFTIKGFKNETVTLSAMKGKLIVLEWFNPACPFIRKFYSDKDMQALQAKYIAQGITWLTITSTNPNHENYVTQEVADRVFNDMQLSSNHLLDDSAGLVGKLYGAKTTPHIFIIDTNGNIAYIGAADADSSPTANPKETKNYIAAALDEQLAGQSVSTPVTTAYGCSIKY
ncbi:MAG: redoxin domain-containing protein [Deltaproteobacteria bacterium]|nr:redoxin domain-containing protein [Deltaproteobacteria bacterium]